MTLMQNEAAGPRMQTEAAGALQRTEAAGPLQRNEAAGPLQRNEASVPLKRNEAAGPLKRNGEMVDKGEYLGVRFPAHCAAAPLALMGRKVLILAAERRRQGVTGHFQISCALWAAGRGGRRTTRQNKQGG